MKIGVVLSTNDPEEVWNAFRFGNVALKENHAVRVFLVNKGVEAEDIKSERFPVKEQLQSFVENKGMNILSLTSKGMPCPVSSTLNSALSSLRLTVIDILPPLVSACNELEIRLVIIRFKYVWSAIRASEALQARSQLARSQEYPC